VNERRTVVGGVISHCVPPNRGERSTRMIEVIEFCTFVLSTNAVVCLSYDWDIFIL